MRATDRLSSCFGKAKIFHLALPDQLLHRPSDVFARHVRINAMLVEQIYSIDSQTLERPIGNLLDMLRPTIQAWRSLHPSRIELRIKIKPEFCRYHHLSAKGSERFAYKFFIGKRPVYFSSVEECDAVLNGCANKSDHLLLVCGRPVRETHTHAAEPKGGNIEIAPSKSALLHFSS